MTDVVDTDSPEAPEPESPSTQAEGKEESLEAASDSEGKAAEAKLEDEKPTPKKEMSERLQKLIDSKGGDQDKFIDGVHESWQSLSKLAKEVQELKESLLKPEKEPEPTFDDNEDYKELQSELQALDQDKKLNESTREEITTEYNKIRAAVERLRGAKEVSPAERHGEFDQKISNLIAEAKRLNKEWEGTFRSDRAIEKEIKALKTKQESVKKQIAESRAQAQREWQEDLEEQARFREEFEQSIIAAATENGIPEARHDKLSTKVKDLALAWLTRQAMLGNNGAVIPKTFVSEVVKDYAEDFGYSKAKQFQEVSKAKVESAKPQQAPAKAPSAPTPKANKPRTADEAKADIHKQFQLLAQRLQSK